MSPFYIYKIIRKKFDLTYLIVIVGVSIVSTATSLALFNPLTSSRVKASSSTDCVTIFLDVAVLLALSGSVGGPFFFVNVI